MPQPEILVVGEPTLEVLSLDDVFRAEGFEMVVVSGAAAARDSLEADPTKCLLLIDWDSRDDDVVDLVEWVSGRQELANLGVIVLSHEAPSELPARIGSRTYWSLLGDSGARQLESLAKAILSNVELQRSLETKATEVEDCFRLLSLGTFELRTQEEAELLSAHLGSAAGDPQLGVCVLELLLNGIEHGNLGITYDDKSRLLESGGYQDEIQRRLRSSEHADKRVRVQFEQHDDRLELIIEDCGQGFDYRRYLDRNPANILDRHGRGILMASALLDVEYLDPGNKVRVSLAMSPSERR